MLATLGGFLLLLSIVGAAYGLVALLFMRRFSAPATEGREAVPLTILRPLYGEEPGLLDNCETLLEQDYDAPVQLVFGVQDLADPAINVVEALIRRHPAADIALVVELRSHGTNGKVSNLINMMAAVKHPVLVLSDSDIAVPRDYLRRVTDVLTRSGTGAVTCFYRGVGKRGFWSRLTALGINWHFLPFAVAAEGLGLATPCMGSTIAIRRDLLDELGGFQAFANVLADDYEIGRAVRARGLAVAIPPILVTHGCREARFPEVWTQESRWLATIRRIDPYGFIGSIVLYPLPLAVAGALLSGFAGYALSALIVVAMARLAVGWRMSRVTGMGKSALWLLPLRDFLSFSLFFSTFFTHSVDWRGARFRVSRKGQLSVPQDHE